MPERARTPRRRVLHITGSWPPLPSGVSDYVSYLHTTLRAGGKYEGDVVTTELAGRSERELEDVVMMVPQWKWREVLRVARFAARGRYDVVHVQMPTEPFNKEVAPGFLPLIIRLLGSRSAIVVTIHEYKRRSRLGRMRSMITALPAARVVTIDECNRAGFPAFIRRKTDVVIVGPNLPSPRPDAPRSSAGGALTLGYFGAIRATKGIETLLEAFALARKERPDLSLVLVGFIDEPYKRAELDPILERLALNEGVTFTGSLPGAEVQAQLHKVDLAVLPFPDGLSGGRTSFTAMAASGVPVITTAPCCATMRGCSPPSVTFPAREDAEGFAEAILRLARDPILLEEARKSAANDASRYSWNTVADRYSQTYEACAR